MHWMNRYTHAMAIALLEHYNGNRQQVAEATDLSAASVSLIARGMTNGISIATIKKLEDAFDKTLAPEVREQMKTISENDL